MAIDVDPGQHLADQTTGTLFFALNARKP